MQPLRSAQQETEAPSSFICCILKASRGHSSLDRKMLYSNLQLRHSLKVWILEEHELYLQDSGVHD